jgi:hypothetical protein
MRQTDLHIISNNCWLHSVDAAAVALGTDRFSALRMLVVAVLLRQPWKPVAPTPAMYESSDSVTAGPIESKAKHPSSLLSKFLSHEDWLPSARASTAMNVALAAPLPLAERLEQKAASLKCPFFRRRFLDAADAARQSSSWLAARHKSILGVLWTPSVEVPSQSFTATETLRAIIRDFERGYYVTGKLSLEHYHPRCFFDSPDPDMPVRSPEIFASALKGLFDRRSSTLELLEEPHLVDNVIVAEWRLAGKLGLPWRPMIKPFVGRTTFTLDGSGLVTSHVEEWSLPAWDAFLATLLPSLQLGAPPAPSAAELVATHDAGAESLHERWPALAVAPPRQHQIASPSLGA